MSKKSNFFDKVRVLLTKQIVYFPKEVTIKADSYLIREVKYTDIRHLIAIEKEVYEGEVPWGKTAFLSELNGPQPVLYLVVEYDQDIVAFVGTRFENVDGHITNIAVSKEFQGRGLAAILLTEVKKTAVKNGYDSLSLEVRVSNMDAQRLYRKFGFVSRSVKKGYYHSNNEDALDMFYRFEDKL